MNRVNNKRKELGDMTDQLDNLANRDIKQPRLEAKHMLPDLDTKLKDQNEKAVPQNFYLQNVHPWLAMYKHDFVTTHMSYDKFCTLLSDDNEHNLFQFLTDLRLLNTCQQCKNCGGSMRKSKQGNVWYWICTRRANGIKCNNHKFSIRKGTFFDKSKLSIQLQLRIIWNFIHRLSITQCKNFCNVSSMTDHTLGEIYADCRNICTAWIWKPEHTPKLGGYGKIVEMDESFFPGAPKFNRGRRLGTSWDDEDKWTFGLTERGSLDCILKQVPSSRSRKSLLPIINQYTLQGTLFCSDGWKAYFKLAEHLDIEDALHFPVNHSKNYVDADTGAHTQTIEGLWGHVKDFLPVRGMKPKDLGSFLGWFMWWRYSRQRDLDLFVHFLKCAAEIRPPSHFSKLPFATAQTLNERKNSNSDEDFL